MATFVFRDYEAEPDGSLRVMLHTDDPGANRLTEYALLFTHAEVSAIATRAQFRAAVIDKLNQIMRVDQISTRLDGLIGESFTIGGDVPR